jgi:hypothetical protein
MAERAGPDSSSILIGMLISLASSLQSQGKLAEALPIHERAHAATQTAHGEGSSGTLASLNNLINIHGRLGHTVEAARLAERLPALVEKAFPPGHPGRGFGNMSASAAFRNAGQFEHAETTGLAAYENMKAAYGDRWETEQALYALRLLYIAWGQPEKLIPWCMRAVCLRFMISADHELEGLVKSFTRIDAEIATARAQLATKSEADQGAGPKADLLEELWARHDEFVPPGHALRAQYLGNLARVNVVRSRPQAALAAAEAARDALVPTDIGERVVWTAMAEALTASGRADEAAAWLERLRSTATQSEDHTEGR